MAHWRGPCPTSAGAAEGEQANSGAGTGGGRGTRGCEFSLLHQAQGGLHGVPSSLWDGASRPVCCLMFFPGESRQCSAALMSCLIPCPLLLVAGGALCAGRLLWSPAPRAFLSQGDKRRGIALVEQAQSSIMLIVLGSKALEKAVFCISSDALL